MKKPKLEMDDPKVESFDAGDARPRTGTVRGSACRLRTAWASASSRKNGSRQGTRGPGCTGTCGNTYGDRRCAGGHYTREPPASTAIG